MIDPLYNIVGGSGSPTSYYFQIDKTVTLQATIPYQIDYNTGQWQYQTVYNQPAYDSLGRLTKTTLFSADSGVGSMDIYLKY